MAFAISNWFIYYKIITIMIINYSEFCILVNILNYDEKNVQWLSINMYGELIKEIINELERL
jgi:hypothetical protein